MPDPTTNYAWDIPNVGGDGGSWGTVANVVFNAIDTQVKNRQNEAATAQTAADLAKSELVQYEQVGAVGNFSGVNASFIADDDATPSVYVVHNNTFAGAVYFPLVKLVVGHKITGFKSYGEANSGYATKRVDLVYLNSTGAEVVVSTGHTLGTSPAEQATTGLNHVVAANRSYYIKLTVSAPATANARIWWVQPTVVRV